MGFQKIFLYVFILNALTLVGQTPGACVSPADSQTVHPQSVVNATAGIATSFTMTACGLTYTQASVRLNQRTTSIIPPTGSAQPATLTVTGIPNCRTILKAFLYVGVISNGGTLTANITNPVSTNSLFPLSIIGSDIDLCWSYGGTYTYRADVTSIISGNGNYLLSGLPFSLYQQDIEGATLFIIYSDPYEESTGSIVIADGCYVRNGSSPTYIGNTITDFNVCDTTTFTSHFMIISDLQQLNPLLISFNTPNNSPPANTSIQLAGQNIWNFTNWAGSPAMAGQTSANYGASNLTDCFALMMAGMYYRTNCLNCPGGSPLTLTASSTPSCTGNATVQLSGGNGPYTYSWTGSSQTTSVITGLMAGTYTVKVADAFCDTAITTVVVSAPAAPITITYKPSICKKEKINIVAGSAASYTWSGPFLNNSSNYSVVASPQSTTTYTLNYSNALGCKNMATITISVLPCTYDEPYQEPGDLTVFPNPAVSSIIVKYDKEEECMIVNVNGKNVSEFQLDASNSFQFEVSGLKPGIYFLKRKKCNKIIKIIIKGE